MPFIKKKQEEVEEVAQEIKKSITKEKEEPQYIAIPRVVSTTEMLNAIYDSQLEIKDMLQKITKELV